MRTTVLAGVVLGITVLTVAPALAAPPEIQQKSCEADGGTFTRDQGTKSCTTTTETTTNTGPVPISAAYAIGTLNGVSSRSDQLSITTTQTQKGNGPVTTSRRVTVLSSTVTPVSCTWDYPEAGIWGYPVDNSFCADNGAFLPPSPLGPMA